MRGCLTTDQLLALESNSLSEHQTRRVLRHCAGCDTCRSLLQERRSNLSYAGQIRKALRLTPGSSGLAANLAAPRIAVPLMTADSIQGYEILGEIHRGGQGVVYRARQKSTDRQVAIKLAFEEVTLAGKRPHRFDREVELAARLKHPNIVSIFDSGMTPDGRCFFVMDHVDGLAVDQYVRERELSLPDALRLFVTICEAVNHAHQRGVIHRDLKPSNILVEQDGVPRLLDFGLAKALPGADTRFRSMVSAAGQLLGTVPYMAPEQLSGQPHSADIRTDVYALGVLLYEILAGGLPYDIGLPASQMLKRILDGSPAPPSRRWNPITGVCGHAATAPARPIACPVGDELDAIAVRAMAAAPEHRYQNAAELGRDIQRYLAGEPVEAKQDRRLYVVRKLLYRHRLPASIAGGFFLLLAVGLTIITALYFKVEEQRVVVQSERDRAVQAQQSESRRAEELRNLMYLGQISSAATALENMNLQRTRDELYVCRTRMREWEWFWLAGQFDHLGRSLGRCEGAVTALVAFPGRFVVSGAVDGTIQLWDLQAMESAGQQAAVGPCRRICVAPDGDHFAVLSATGELTLHSQSDGGVMRVEHSGEARGVCYSADSRFVAIGDAQGRLTVYSAADGQVAASMGSQAAPCTTTMAFSPSGDLLATGVSDSTVCVYEWRSGTRIHVLPQQECTTQLLWMADSKRLILGGWWGSLTACDVQTGRSERAYASRSGGTGDVPRAHTGQITAMVLCRDDRLLISADSEGNIAFWDTVTGSSCGKLIVDRTPVTSLAVTGEPQWLVAGRADGSVRVWDMAELTFTIAIQAHQGQSRAVAFGGPDRVATAGDDAQVKLWDVATASLLQVFVGHKSDSKVRSLAYSPDGTFIASGSTDQTIRIWDVQSGATRRVLEGHEDSVLSLAISGDGGWIASGGSDFDTRDKDIKDNSVRIWDSQRGVEHMCLRGHGAGVTGVAFSPDGALVASASRDKTARVWSLKTGRTVAVFEGHKDIVHSVVFTPDGESVLSAGADHMVHAWDPLTGAPNALPTKLASRLLGLAISPDGSRKAVSGNWGHIGLWPSHDVDWELLRLRGPQAQCWAMSFSPDGRNLAAVDEAGMLWIWRAIRDEDLSRSPLAASDLAAGAARLWSLRQYEEARLVFAESLDMHRRLFGDQDPRTIALLQAIEQSRVAPR